MNEERATTLALFNELLAEGFSLSVVEGKLRFYNDDATRMTDDLKARMIEHKQGLIDYLTTPPSGRPGICGGCGEEREWIQAEDKRWVCSCYYRHEKRDAYLMRKMADIRTEVDYRNGTIVRCGISA